MSIYEILPDDDHHHYFCRFELENMSIYEILPALDLTQSVHDKICIRMDGEGKDILCIASTCRILVAL
jgi:hypothetical protein